MACWQPKARKNCLNCFSKIYGLSERFDSAKPNPWLSDYQSGLVYHLREIRYRSQSQQRASFCTLNSGDVFHKGLDQFTFQISLYKIRSPFETATATVWPRGPMYPKGRDAKVSQYQGDSFEYQSITVSASAQIQSRAILNL